MGDKFDDYGNEYEAGGEFDCDGNGDGEGEGTFVNNGGEGEGEFGGDGDNGGEDEGESGGDGDNGGEGEGEFGGNGDNGGEDEFGGNGDNRGEGEGEFGGNVDNGGEGVDVDCTGGGSNALKMLQFFLISPALPSSTPTFPNFTSAFARSCKKKLGLLANVLTKLAVKLSNASSSSICRMPLPIRSCL
jgi:hypothetical protein